MSGIRFSVAVGLALVLAQGCGKDDHPAVSKLNPGSSGGKSSNTSSDGGANLGGGGAGEVTVPGAPIVTITSPLAAKDPNDDEVILADEALVVCTAVQSKDDGSKPVAPESVKLSVLDADGLVVDEAVGAATKNADEYSSNFVIKDVKSGPLSFHCEASDTSTDPLVGSDEVSSLVDHGPIITVVSPQADAFYALKGAVPFEFKVKAAPLTKADNEAGIDTVTLNVNGKDFEVTEGATAGVYETSIDFSSTKIFEQTANGPVPVLIKATNKRTPDAATSSYEYSFAIDSEGPTIEITSHQNQDIIGAKEVLEFTVTDAISGVDTQTVAVVIGDVENLFQDNTPWSHTGDAFGYELSSQTIADGVVQATLNIYATDNVGNESTGESLTLYLDRVPPELDLDPDLVRETKKTTGTTYTCSDTFDVLGTAASDLDGALPFTLFRSVVWDDTNFKAGQTVLYRAGADPESVFLYLKKPDSSTPLLIHDTGAGDDCNEIDTTDTVLLHLDPVDQTGTAKASGEHDIAPAFASLAGGTCVDPLAIDPPTLCSGDSDMTRVIKHAGAGNEPVIYAYAPESGTAECTGARWQIGGVLTGNYEGWLCLATRAEDLVHNVGVSPPLRVCYDDPDIIGTPDCSPDTAPDCTDGCTPLPGFGVQFINDL